MAKKTDSVISLEIEKYKKKIAEFQDYLEKHNNLELAEDKYKEAKLQIDLMNALPSWILSLKQMEENIQTKAKEFRGGEELNDIARLMSKNKDLQ